MESKKRRIARVEEIFSILDPRYTREKTALKYQTPFQLLISTILSAQCTDKQVNAVTKVLFQKYLSPEDFLAVPISELEMDIRSTGFFRNKAKSIKGCCQGLLERYGGEVPATMGELVKLPGVGRKTANVVLNTAFGQPTIAVDTHIYRVANRTAIASGKTVLEVEKKLIKFIPDEFKVPAHHLMILHGRYVCKARSPHCPDCTLLDLCEYEEKNI